MDCPTCGHLNRESAPGTARAVRRRCSRRSRVRYAGRRSSRVLLRPVRRDDVAVEERRAEPPKHLAEKILPRAALEGERKQVTVLFADVKGSMDLPSRSIPEEWHEIMDRFFAILSEASTASRAPSTSSRATASWRCSARRSRTRTTRSARATRRSTAARLGRYADELRLAHGLSFSVRMGLNSGEVVVGKIGDDLRMDYTAQGHTVGLAARMEQLADRRAASTSRSARRSSSAATSRSRSRRVPIKGVASRCGSTS